MKHALLLPAVLLYAAAFVCLPAAAQDAPLKATVRGVPDMDYRAVPNFFKSPPGQYMGETQGIATNSKGDIFVFFRGNQTRLWEFDKTGKFVREIGKNYYGFLYAHSVRIDAHDNIWTADEGANLVTEFNPDGSRVLMVLGHKPAITDGIPPSSQRAGPPATKYSFCRPTDMGWDKAGNIFVADGYCNDRVVKYGPDGHFITQVGSDKPGRGNNEFGIPHALVVDNAGNVYVSDRSNSRVQVFDNDLHFKASYDGFGAMWTLCVSQGPHQYLFVSNSNPNGNVLGSWDGSGQIYKLELDGTPLGKFGNAGKIAPDVDVVHGLDCRDPNQVYVAEIETWRAQKFVLQSAKTSKGGNAQ